MKMMINALVAGLAIWLALPAFADAQTVNSERRDRVNAGVIGIIAGPSQGTMTRYVEDIASAIDPTHGVRVLPMLGRGSIANIEDLLYLRGVDIALVQGDVLDFFQDHPEVEPQALRKIRYVAQLGLEEAHLLTRQEITSVDQLAGEKVNFGKRNYGSFMSATLLFSELGLTVEPTTYGHKKALLDLKNGDISAMFWMAAAPVGGLEGVSLDDGLHLIDIPDGRIGGLTYSPAQLTSVDYPDLVPPNAPIATVQVSTVMAAYDWPTNHRRYEGVKRFVEAFRGDFDKLRQPPYHPKWKEMDLAAEVQGWTRFE